MRKLYLLCVVTLLAVLVDIVFFHSRTANAQDTGNYKVTQLDRSRLTVSLTGTVVGFSCVESQGATWCYALTKQ